MEVKNSKQELEVMLEASHMTLENFLKMVKEMRDLQKEYFQTCDTEVLKKAKQAERAVDKYIAEYENPSLIFDKRQ